MSLSGTSICYFSAALLIALAIFGGVSQILNTHQWHSHTFVNIASNAVADESDLTIRYQPSKALGSIPEKPKDQLHDDAEEQIDNILNDIRKRSEKIDIIADGDEAYRLKDGMIAFKAPRRLDINETTVAQIFLSANEDNSKVRDIFTEYSSNPERIETRSFQFIDPLSATFAARLSANPKDFYIHPSLDEYQKLDDILSGKWSWMVTPLRDGKKIPLTVSIMQYPHGKDNPGKEIVTITREFHVQSGMLDKILSAAIYEKEIQTLAYVIGTIFSSITGLLGYFYYKKRTKKKSKISRSMDVRREYININGEEFIKFTDPDINGETKEFIISINRNGDSQNI